MWWALAMRGKASRFIVVSELCPEKIMHGGDVKFCHLLSVGLERVNARGVRWNGSWCLHVWAPRELS